MCIHFWDTAHTHCSVLMDSLARGIIAHFVVERIRSNREVAVDQESVYL